MALIEKLNLWSHFKEENDPSIVFHWNGLSLTSILVGTEMGSYIWLFVECTLSPPFDLLGFDGGGASCNVVDICRLALQGKNGGVLDKYRA